MRFNFTEDQTMFGQSLGSFLENEYTAEFARSLWDTDTGRSDKLWTALAGLGVTGVVVPAEHGGLGLSMVEMAILLEEAGRATLAEPLIDGLAVAAPLLSELGGELAANWLPKVAAGEARIAVGHEISPTVADAATADLLLVQQGDELHGLVPAQVELEPQPSNDPSSRLFAVRWQVVDETRLASGDEARRLLDLACDHGAVATAAYLLGAGRAMVAQAAAYANEREQFGKPIGSFQAVKHHLANVQVRLEFARPVLYRAAYALCQGDGSAAATMAASHAKAAASEAALLAAKTALQVHGAIGYTWELDLQIWMKRAWAVEASWGTGLWHRSRLATALLDQEGSREAATIGGV
ncbi:MAG: acyl-CoA dehydrogenase family protein [Deltaproteobacteria bacterium]